MHDKLDSVKLTFSTVILNNKSLSDAFSNPSTLIVTTHPHCNPELPAPDPATVISELNVPSWCNPIPHDQVHFPCKQRSLPSSLLDYMPPELLARPVLVIARSKISVENHEL